MVKTRVRGQRLERLPGASGRCPGSPGSHYKCWNHDTVVGQRWQAAAGWRGAEAVAVEGLQRVLLQAADCSLGHEAVWSEASFPPAHHPPGGSSQQRDAGCQGDRLRRADPHVPWTPGHPDRHGGTGGAGRAHYEASSGGLWAQKQSVHQRIQGPVPSVLGGAGGERGSCQARPGGWLSPWWEIPSQTSKEKLFSSNLHEPGVFVSRLRCQSGSGGGMASNAPAPQGLWYSCSFHHSKVSGLSHAACLIYWLGSFWALKSAINFYYFEYKCFKNENFFM